MSKRKFGEAKIWEKPQIKIEWVEEEMTSYATTGTLIDLFAETPHFAEFKKCLPIRVSNNSYPTEVFASPRVFDFTDKDVIKFWAHECPLPRSQRIEGTFKN